LCRASGGVERLAGEGKRFGCIFIDAAFAPADGGAPDAGAMDGVGTVTDLSSDGLRAAGAGGSVIGAVSAAVLAAGAVVATGGALVSGALLVGLADLGVAGCGFGAV